MEVYGTKFTSYKKVSLCNIIHEHYTELVEGKFHDATATILGSSQVGGVR